MADFTLVIGNKNYSSWSMRAWLVLHATGARFDELRIPLDRNDTRRRIVECSSAGRQSASQVSRPDFRTGQIGIGSVSADSVKYCISPLCPGFRGSAKSRRQRQSLV